MERSAITEYLDQLQRHCRDVLGPNLAGLYLHGSMSTGDPAERSDIDAIGLVHGPVTSRQRAALFAQLDPSTLPVPAAGLELMLVRADTARTPPRVPMVELAISTGSDWTTEIETDVAYEELLIDLAACRDHGRTLFGPPPSTVIGAIERNWLIEVLSAALHWHRTVILDQYHDYLGQNAVLNAARAWCYVATGQLVSKASGAAWAIENGLWSDTVARAMAIRSGTLRASLEIEEVDATLAEAIYICDNALGCVGR